MKYRNRKIGFKHYQSLWNLANPSVAMLPRCQLNFRAMRWLYYCILWFREFFCGKMSYKITRLNPWTHCPPPPPPILVRRLPTTCIHMYGSPSVQRLAGEIFSSKTAWQLFNLGRFKEICIPHLLCHVGLRLRANCISRSWHRLISP